MKPMVVVNAFVERIEGNLAIIAVSNDRSKLTSHRRPLSEHDKKYLILVRKLIPPATTEGLTIQVSLGQDGIAQASPDLETTIKKARAFNEVMDMMARVPA